MRIIRTALLFCVATLSVNALAVEYTMSCADVIEKLHREATDAARERFANLEGSCMGVIERDGELFMHTKMVVRAVRGNEITIYLPATDRTFKIDADPKSRITIGRQKIRPRDMSRGQELNIYVSVDEFTQPIVTQVAFETEEAEELVVAPAVIAPALPTTG